MAVFKKNIKSTPNPPIVMINNVCNRFLFQLITITLSLFLLTEVSARPSRKGNDHSKPSPHFKHGGKGHPSKGRNFRGGFRGPKFAEPFHRGSVKKKVSLTTEEALVTSLNVNEAVLQREKGLAVYVRSSKIQGTV